MPPHSWPARASSPAWLGQLTVEVLCHVLAKLRPAIGCAWGVAARSRPQCKAISEKSSSVLTILQLLPIGNNCFPILCNIFCGNDIGIVSMMPFLHVAAKSWFTGCKGRRKSECPWKPRPYPKSLGTVSHSQARLWTRAVERQRSANGDVLDHSAIGAGPLQQGILSIKKQTVMQFTYKLTFIIWLKILVRATSPKSCTYRHV